MREDLALGARIAGPALIIEPHQTIVVEDGWRAEITAKNHVVLRRVEAGGAARGDRHQGRSGHARDLQQPLHVDRRADGRDAAEHRLFRQHQGAARFLLRGFDAEGRLVANAPHMPVHLGSMDRSVETIIRLNQGKIRAGDVFALNAPYNGGTHLPDITVCTPVFDEAGKTILFWVASRGHHADIGGVAPGSMSPRATNIRRGRRLYRQFPAGRSRPVPREGALCAAGRRPLSGAQSAAERQRPQGADRRQRKGRARTQAHGRDVLACNRRRLHGPCAGQRRRERAARHRPAEGQRIHRRRPTRARSSR